MRYRFLRFPNGKAKAVTFSYDDGCKADKRFSDVISKYGIKCTFNFCGTNFVNNFIDEEVEEYFYSRGHEIAIHGAEHRAEGLQRPIDGIRDVLNCRLELEKRFNRIIRGMAYSDSGISRFSNGASYENIKSYLKDLDIVYARTLGGDNNKFALPDDWYAWMPTAHHINPDILKYIDEFVSLDLSKSVYSAARQPRLFYMWGHSYEFDNNNNWEHLDNICEKIANKEDIWYATNIEIYDYVTAYNSLVFSADSTIVYNPNLMTVWFDIDGQQYVVKPGETINIK